MVRRLLSSPALKLAWFVLCALGVILITQHLTQERISKNEANWNQQVLLTLLEGVAYDNEPAQERLPNTDSALPSPYLARFEGRITARIWPVASDNGYNGPIKILVALNAHGQILNLAVTSHQETPGLGDLIEAQKSDWSRQFIGRSLADRWSLRQEGGDFDALTRATVSSKAMIKGLFRALQHQSRALVQSAPEAGDQP